MAAHPLIVLASLAAMRAVSVRAARVDGMARVVVDRHRPRRLGGNARGTLGLGPSSGGGATFVLAMPSVAAA
jgi:hypothetical protein